MSNKANIGSVLVIFLIAMCTLSCKKNCSQIACHNYGYVQMIGPSSLTFQENSYEVCNNGACYCRNGFEGDSCQVLSVNKFMNISFIASDNCSGSTGYVVTMNDDPNNVSHVIMYNLFGLGQVDGYIISGPNHTGTTINIPSPNGSAGALDYYGTGTYSLVYGYARISFNMDFTSNGIEKNCTVLLQQQ